MTLDLTRAASELADELRDRELVTYLDVLDALATLGLTLIFDLDRSASREYVTTVDLEGTWANS